MQTDTWRVILQPGNDVQVILKNGITLTGTIAGDPNVNAVLRLEQFEGWPRADSQQVHLIDWGEIAAVTVRT